MNNIQQLIKKSNQGGHSNVTPKTSIEAVQGLKDILDGFNMYFLSYTGSAYNTRLTVPKTVRKEGLWITYVDYDHKIVTEWYNSDKIDDASFGDGKNWRKGSNMLVGDITIGTNGNWYIEGKDSGFKAQGETGVTPILRMEPNTKAVQVTYDEGKNWEDVSPRLTTFTPHLAENGELTWTNEAGLPNPMPINLTGPSGVPSDAAHVVQTTGDSATDVMSQDAVTKELNKLDAEFDPINFNSVVEVPIEDIETSSTSEEGVLVYNKVNNKFLWNVGGALPVSKYYLATTRNELVGTSPIIGKMYIDKDDNTWIGIKNNLSVLLRSEIVEI